MRTYVYGISGSSHPLQVDGLRGVGVQAPPLRVVRHDGLAAVVSDAPEDLRAKRRDLEAHEEVLEALCADGTVLPMRFGTVAPDDDEIRSELAHEASRYTALLSQLDGAVELNVKAGHREDAVLRDLLLQHRHLRERNERLRATGGGSHQDRMEFGEQVAAALDERRARDAERVVAALRQHASRTRLGPPVENCFTNASFLVARAARGSFDAAVARVRTRLADVADVNVFGPLPPYSFVDNDDAVD